jgi:hypothetical protein
MTRLNKATKSAIVDKAISDKFKTQYEKAFRAVTVAARDFVVLRSHHVEFKALNLSVEMLSHVRYGSHITLRNDIHCNVDFIECQRGITFDDPVFAVTYNKYLVDDDIVELAQLRSLIGTIETERDELTSVIFSYINVKTLLADLPWVEKYLPVASSACTGLIAADVIADINAKFGK